MKCFMIGLLCLAAVTTQQLKPGPQVRQLPADVLRDFPGRCFASTSCSLHFPGQTWSLKPFCGAATCVRVPGSQELTERVEDCGVLPKPDPRCKVINENQFNETYPTCCPVFKCEPGVELTYPTAEELRQQILRAQQQSIHGVQEATTVTEEQQTEAATEQHI